MFDILLALGILFGVVYAVWSLIGIAITIYVARKGLRSYRQAKQIATVAEPIARQLYDSGAIPEQIISGLNKEQARQGFRQQ